jgi:hypothetical protein
VIEDSGRWWRVLVLSTGVFLKWGAGELIVYRLLCCLQLIQDSNVLNECWLRLCITCIINQLNCRDAVMVATVFTR